MYRIGKEEIDAVARALNSRDFFKINNSGREVYHFEEEWKAITGSKYMLTMTSGYGALTSALIGMGVGPGDEVIVPGYTYIASALAVLATGAIPVIADINETMTLDPADVERRLSSHTKAIMPVHIQGFPSDMDALCALAAKHNLRVLEDACQSDGGMYHGRYLGTIGDAGAHSFNYYKVITSGEGGALVTDDREIYERALIYHDAAAVAFFGDQLNGIKEPLFGGGEFRVSDITGALLREQLKRMPSILADLRSRRAYLAELISGKLELSPSNDIAGDCGTTLSLRFDSSERAFAFEAKCGENGISATVPIQTGKHVYTNWTQVTEKRGALNPLMDPYKMEANRGLQANYSPDVCARTLRILESTVYVSISPDWTDAEVESIAARLIQSAAG